MRIGLAADHAGFDLKNELADRLRVEGHEVSDYGANTRAPDDDYPDYVIPLARAVAERQVDRGVAVCGSGVGAAIAANKVRGARAVAALDARLARMGGEQEDANVLCLGARRLGSEPAWEITREFLETVGGGEPRPAGNCG